MRSPARDAEVDRRVDEVRARLREMGYLRNPLEAFVAGRVARAASLRALAEGSLRLGVAGGLLVAILAWLGTLALNPALGVTDLALLALYLVLIYALSVAGIAGVAGAALLAVTRASGPRSRPGPFISASGALATALTFLYGTLWWRWFLFAPDARPLASRAHLFAGFLIVLSALLLGRLARIWAAVLLEAGRAEGAPGAGGASARPRTREAARLAGAGLLAGALFFAYLTVTREEDHASARWAADFEVTLAHETIVLIGIDGLSWETVHYLAERGDLPNLAAIVARSARAPLAPIGDAPPPEIWTTIATGETPLRHGVRAFVLPRLAGMRAPIAVGPRPPAFVTALRTVIPSLGLATEVPVSGLTRRSKAIWEIVGEKGYFAAAVNWWATWPAAGVHGEEPYVGVVSDRAFARLTGPRRESVDLTGDVSDARLARAAHEVADSVLAALGAASGATAPGDVEVSRLARAGDLFALAMAERQFPRASLHGEGGILAVYLPGLDILARPLAETGPRAAGLAAVDARLAAIRGHARAIDAAIGRIDAHLRRVSSPPWPHAIALVMTPGECDPERPRAPGLFAFAGPGAREPGILPEVRAEQIAPTLLAYLGFPTSRAMRAGPRTDFFADSLLAKRPPTIVASFGERRLPAVSDASHDEEFLERLRSLGYIR